MKQVIVKVTKLTLDDDFNIVDLEAEEKMRISIENLKEELISLEDRRCWVEEMLVDVDVEINEIKNTLKGYGIES